MNADRYAKLGIDYEEGVQRFAGNEEVYQKFLQKFAEDTSFQVLDEAMRQKDYGTAFTAAHTLKGITGNLSMNRLYHLLVPFVEILRDGSNNSGAIEFYPQVSEAYQELIKGLKEMK